MFGLDSSLTLLLIICLLAACAFEFINGFHDTANAVATVIYTNSLKPTFAVIWSGFFNFLGVYVGGIAVALGIINLLPMSILVDQSVSHNVAMILALILTAIIWNLGTWYLGIPCSSSHTLIGSIFGVGLAYGLLPHSASVALNWGKVKDVGISLLISPLFGFFITMLIVLILKNTLKKKNDLFDEPKKKKAPPLWIRSILVLTCTSVSFSHGSNDGQKGVGLILIILIGLAPLKFALNHEKNVDQLYAKVTMVESNLDKLDMGKASSTDKASIAVIKEQIDTIQKHTQGISDYKLLNQDEHFKLRKSIMVLSKEYSKLMTLQPEDPGLAANIPKAEKKAFDSSIGELKKYVEYAPWWVILLISVSLGFGTMIGWKRIVVTIGEKIGKDHLTYAQGASAELVAASTISVSTLLGLPVSTTHVLSSGIAGSMVASGGLKNLRMKTVRNILVAWLITIPATVLLSGLLFLLFRWIMS
jgi:PiT family inorganic phosphate transporter